MKYFLIIFCSVFFLLYVFVQLVNNECVDLIDFGVVLICIGDIYINVDVMSSSSFFVDVFICFNGGVVSNDVYFGFIVDVLLVDVIIMISGMDMGFNGIFIENL